MDNKQQIQANNAELEKHKQDILSLPMADDVKNGKYVWGKYDAKGGTLLSFTISDSETAYPDGGEKDGFWWERVKEVNFPESINKISFDSFTLSEDVVLSKDLGYYRISHSLKEKPKKVYIIAEKTFYQFDEDLTYFEWKDTEQKSYRFITGSVSSYDESARLISNKTGLSEKGYAMIDAEKLTLYWISDNYQTLILRGGNTYTLITLA